MSENDINIYCQIVEMRSTGLRNLIVGHRLGISARGVVNRVNKIKYNYKNPNNRSNMIKTLCERLAMTPTEIIDAVNTKTKFTFLTSSKPLNIKIKDTISSPELWYHSYRGETLEVVKRDGQYYTNTPAKLRIKHQDCVEV